MGDAPDTLWLHTMANMQEEIDRLRAENERLREFASTVRSIRFACGNYRAAEALLEKAILKLDSEEE